MKRAVLLTLFTLASLITIAQSSSNVTNSDTSKTYITELRQHTEISEDNLITNSSYNLKDDDGNLYNAIIIGDQLWMTENLRATKLNDGTAIPQVSDYTIWGSLTTPGYCWYNNSSGTISTGYGALYNGYTVSTGKLCPKGWHIPSDAEWTTLTTFLGGERIAGGKLKEAGNKHWFSPNEGATNESGFTALPGGSRGSLGSFMDEGLRGHWWSSTEHDKTKIWNNNMGYSFSYVTETSDHKKSGLSVRCLKD